MGWPVLKLLHRRSDRSCRNSCITTRNLRGRPQTRHATLAINEAREREEERLLGQGQKEARAEMQQPPTMGIEVGNVDVVAGDLQGPPQPNAAHPVGLQMTL